MSSRTSTVTSKTTNGGTTTRLAETMILSTSFPPSQGVAYKKRGETQVKGRGRVNTSLIHPSTYLEPIRNWLNRLKWKPRGEVRTSTPSETTTLLEGVVDLELSTGIRIGDSEGIKMTWGMKAKRLAYYIRTLARINTVSWIGITLAYTKALRPTTDATSFTPLGGPLMSGFKRKAIWADPRAPNVVAINVWKAKENQAKHVRTSSLRI